MVIIWQRDLCTIAAHMALHHRCHPFGHPNSCVKNKWLRCTTSFGSNTGGHHNERRGLPQADPGLVWRCCRHQPHWLKYSPVLWLYADHRLPTTGKPAIRSPPPKSNPSTNQASAPNHPMGVVCVDHDSTHARVAPKPWADVLQCGQGLHPGGSHAVPVCAPWDQFRPQNLRARQPGGVNLQPDRPKQTH